MKKINIRLVAIISTIITVLFVLSTIFYSTFISAGSNSILGQINILLNQLAILPFYLLYSLLSVLNPNHDSEGIAWTVGIMTEYIGPIAVFIFWFIVSSIFSYVYNWIFSRSSVIEFDAVPVKKISTKLVLSICVIFVIIINFIPLIYIRRQIMQEASQYKIEEKHMRTEYEQSINGNYFLIRELAIKFKLPSQLAGFVYKVIETNPTRTVIGFSTTDLSKFVGCGAEKGPLGVMVMYPHSNEKDIVKTTSFLLLDAPRKYDTRMENGGGYHPYSPYTIGNSYYFYDDPFETTDDPANPTYKYFQHPAGYYGYIGACSSNPSAVKMQSDDIKILQPSLSTVGPI